MEGMNLITLSASLASILFAYLAFKRSDKEEKKNEGKSEGVMFSDIGYIKACIERVENQLIKVEERDSNIIERLVKVEETIINITQRVNELSKVNTT